MDMITIDYFSDVLCVWAYGGQVRLEELQQTLGDRVLVRQRFMPLFADTRVRIGEGWQEQGGFAGFGAHMQEVCARWPHTRLHPAAWCECRPASCTTAHVFLRAAALCLGCDDAGEDTDRAALAVFDGLAGEVRRAFFEQALDVSRMDVLLRLLDPLEVTPEQVRHRLDNGEAYASLHRDEQLMKAHGVQGSPTYVFNEGRQMLYGNVGYRIIEANVRELLAAPPAAGAPSWC
jgi:predicted DsbA family dithiol-disulfide isomerase